jgi:hypothetical protein
MVELKDNVFEMNKIIADEFTKSSINSHLCNDVNQWGEDTNTMYSRNMPYCTATASSSATMIRLPLCGKAHTISATLSDSTKKTGLSSALGVGTARECRLGGRNGEGFVRERAGLRGRY